MLISAISGSRSADICRREGSELVSEKGSCGHMVSRYGCVLVDGGKCLWQRIIVGLILLCLFFFFFLDCGGGELSKYLFDSESSKAVEKILALFI